MSFRHPSSRQGNVFTDLSLNVPVGTTLALVGASGSGKYTLAKIAAGLYAPDSGNAIWRCKAPPRAPLRIASVMQDSQLFNLPFDQNIAFGDEEVSIDYNRVTELVEICSLDIMLRRLPMGFQTALGSSGFQVSCGEAQRILIARALYSKLDLLILDEATNALDKDTEAHILATIRTLLPRLRS